MPTGYLCLFINAHMPYVAPLENNYAYLDKWLCTSIFASYLPLIDMLDRLSQEGVPYKVNMAVSPSLLEVLTSAKTEELFAHHLQRRHKTIEHELQRWVPGSAEANLVLICRSCWDYVEKIYYQRYKGHIAATLNRLVKQGHLELLVGSATGAYLPLLEPLAPLAWGQIQCGLTNFKKYFSAPPQGFWSYAAGYTPEMDQVLLNSGLKYTIVRAPSLLGATPRPQAATFRPVRTPAGLTVFATDIEAALDLFQHPSGFLFAPEYLDLRCSKALDFSEASSVQEPDPYTMIYYSQRRRGEQNQLYDLELARQTAQAQAQQFIANRQRQARWVAAKLGKPAVITLSLKAEMLGQGWYEGFIWLEQVLRGLSSANSEVHTALFSSLSADPDLQVCTPNLGSSGQGSFNLNWLNGNDSWLFKQAHLAGRRMLKMAQVGHHNDEPTRRLLNQAGRELLLTQCSDWSTLISCGLDSKWARSTVRRHLVSFHKLFDDFREGRVDAEGLRTLEQRCPIFPNLDYRDCFRYHERKESDMTTGSQESSATPATIKKEEVIAGIIQIQKVTRELAVLCQQALSTDMDVSPDITNKARESVAIVEDLAKRAHDPASLQRYLETTTILENIVKVIADTNDTQELLNLHSQAIDAVDAWAGTVENLLKGIIAQADSEDKKAD